MKKNIVLIGMPSSGKSTVGEFLAKKMGRSFVDTDLLIKNRENKALKDIVNTEGLKKFLEIQESVILGMNVCNCVIATGGGVIHGDDSMEHLKEDSIIVYLKLPFSAIESRVTPERRFAKSEGQSLLELYKERIPLYEKYADVIIDCSDMEVEEIANVIIKRLQNDWQGNSGGEVL